jgi:hypothetical protein
MSRHVGRQTFRAMHRCGENRFIACEMDFTFSGSEPKLDSTIGGLFFAQQQASLKFCQWFGRLSTRADRPNCSIMR